MEFFKLNILHLYGSIIKKTVLKFYMQAKLSFSFSNRSLTLKLLKTSVSYSLPAHPSPLTQISTSPSKKLHRSLAFAARACRSDNTCRIQKKELPEGHSCTGQVTSKILFIRFPDWSTGMCLHVRIHSWLLNSKQKRLVCSKNILNHLENISLSTAEI